MLCHFLLSSIKWLDRDSIRGGQCLPVWGLCGRYWFHWSTCHSLREKEREKKAQTHSNTVFMLNIRWTLWPLHYPLDNHVFALYNWSLVLKSCEMHTQRLLCHSPTDRLISSEPVKTTNYFSLSCMCAQLITECQETINPRTLRLIFVCTSKSDSNFLSFLSFQVSFVRRFSWSAEWTICSSDIMQRMKQVPLVQKGRDRRGERKRMKKKRLNHHRYTSGQKTLHLVSLMLVYFVIELTRILCLKCNLKFTAS